MHRWGIYEVGFCWIKLGFSLLLGTAYFELFCLVVAVSCWFCFYVIYIYESDILVGPYCLDIHYFVPISLNLKASFLLAEMKILQFFTCICCPFATLTNLLQQIWGICED